VTLDGLHSGVPTRTTPTLTPTTLRNIEQTFIELQSEVESHQNEAGFVPPVVQPVTQGSTYMSVVDSKAWQGGIASVVQTRPSVVTAAAPATAMTTTRRNMGGRRPIKNSGISPEEEERRRLRRERNKMAAARCRKRRMDHTNALLMETEGLEQKKQGLQQEIQQLQMQKEELEFLLEAHKACCRLSSSGQRSPQDIKPFVYPPSSLEDKLIRVKQEIDDANTTATVPISHPTPPKRPILATDATAGMKPSRPNSLPVAAAFTPSLSTLKAAVSVSEVAGIPITTPSAGIPFNFDSLMEGGTGLTPVSTPLVPSCSSQQRSSTGCVDLSSPDSVPPKLVSL